MRRVLPIFKRGGKSRATYNVASDQQQEGSSDTSLSNQPLDRAAVQTAPAGPSTSPKAALSFPDGITVWHDCPNATVDICFVHGLTGNRESTWTTHGQPVPWPKTLLPSNLPNARLLTYGYDAYVVRKSVVSTNRLIHHASNLLNDLCNSSSRPLILVVHSLGGLVCKEAILLSQNNPEPHLRGIFNRVIGVVFMGTPHKGAWMANWAHIPASALGLFKSSNKSLLATLETENQLLESIQAKFLSMVREVREGGRSLEVTCFFEELPLPVAGHVVSKDSAIIDGYTSISIHANHRDMVRFASAEDAGYKRLLGELTRWERLATSASSQRVVGAATMYRANAAKNHIQPCHYIPFPKNKRFVGREETLDQLRKIFVNNESQKVAVVGLGGVGKTQVALRFAYWIRETRPEYSTFWVPVLSQACFEQAYAEIARKLPIQKSTEDEDPKESVRRYLSSEEAGPWLLVVDNADDMDMFFGCPDTTSGISHYLPVSESGLILFTTRSRDVAVSVAGSDIIDLPEMSSHEAMGLLEKSLIRKGLLRDKVVATELLRELTYLPLAITQAAAYLNRNQVSIAKYMGLLRATEQDTIGLISREFHDSTRYINSQNAIATTWLVSFEQIRKSDSAAAELLSFMSCIEPKAIPQLILPSLESEEQVVHAIGTLCGYAFVARRGDDTVFDMHSLVHLATQIWVQKEGLVAQTTEKAMHHIEEVFPTDDYANRSLWRYYMPHVLRVLHGDCGVEMEERYSLCLWVGRCLLEDGRIKEAVGWLEECYGWRKNRFPEDNPSRLASQQVLATAYQVDGQVRKAVMLLEQVVAIEEKTLTEEDASRLASQHALAWAYRADGQAKKAITLLEHTVAMWERTPDEHHSDRLASQQVLALAYQDDGQVKKAMALLEHVVAMREKTLDEDHPHRLASQNSLAPIYLDDGQVKKAVALLEHVVAMREKSMAEDHPSRLSSQHNLAIAYRYDGQVKKAVVLLEHVVMIREKTLAEDDPDQLKSQGQLGLAYRDNGQVKKAVTLLEHVVMTQERTLGEDHPDRLISQHNLALAYQDDGQVKKAVTLLEHTVAMLEKTLAEDHPSRLKSQNALAWAYQADGQAKKGG